MKVLLIIGATSLFFCSIGSLFIDANTRAGENGYKRK